jgi:hypothetical protein
MTDAGEREREILARARVGLGPTATQSRRLRLAIDVALASGAGPHGPRGQAGRLGGGWPRRWLMATALAGAAGALGYGAGHRAGGAAERAAIVTTAAPASVASEAPPSQGATAGVATAAPAIAGAGLERSHGPRPPAAPPAGRRARPPALDDEVRAVRSIERALRDGEPGFALALLRELDRALPDGRLVEEREALSAIARCQLDEAPLGVSLGDDFAERRPDSVYLRRVQQACRAEARGGRSRP